MRHLEVLGVCSGVEWFQISGRDEWRLTGGEGTVKGKMSWRIWADRQSFNLKTLRSYWKLLIKRSLIQQPYGRVNAVVHKLFLKCFSWPFLWVCVLEKIGYGQSNFLGMGGSLTLNINWGYLCSFYIVAVPHRNVGITSHVLYRWLEWF